MQGTFWITSECNLNCIYCYEGDNKKKQIMTEEVIVKSAELIFETMLLQNDQQLKVVIHGGEPFLAFDKMKYLIEYMKKAASINNINISFGCTTNATLLDNKMINYVLEEIDDFTISLDGKKETQDFTRPFSSGKGTHEVVEKNLIELLGLQPNIRVRLTYNSKTVKNLYENIKYLMDLGVKYIVPVRDFYDKEFTESIFRIFNRELIKLKEILNQYTNVHVSLLDTTIIKKLGRCSGGLFSFNIDPIGKIYPCMLTVGQSDFEIGNVFVGIDKYKRDKLLSYSEKENKECKGCDYYHYCNETRCKIINKLVTGGYCVASPIACREQNILYDLNFRFT